MSNDKNEKKLESEIYKKVSQVLNKMLDEKFEDDIHQMMGASEVLHELIKNKVVYQILTNKGPFEIMTHKLVMDDEDVKRHMYQLLIHLISYYEQHERFEKRINIDNFSDEDIVNSHSGSGLFNKSKNSKNSKKQIQEVFKDM